MLLHTINDSFAVVMAAPVRLMPVNWNQVCENLWKVPWVLEHGLIEQQRLNAKCQELSKRCQRMSMDGWPPQLFGTLFTIIFRKNMVGSSKVSSQLGLEQMFPSSILRTSSKTRLLRFLKRSWRIDKTGVVWACLMQLQ